MECREESKFPEFHSGLLWCFRASAARGALGDRTTATLRPRQDPLPPLPPPRALSKVHDSHCSCTLVVVNSSAPPPQLVHPSQHLGPVSAPCRRFSCVVPAAPLFQRCQEGKRAFSLHIFPLGCRPCPPAHRSPLPLRRVGSRTTRVRAGEHQGPRTAHGGNLGGSSMPLSRTTAHHIVN